LDTDHRTDLVGVRRGDLGGAQLPRPARLANPVGSRARLASSIGDMDIAAKPDDIAKSQIIEELE